MKVRETTAKLFALGDLVDFGNVGQLSERWEQKKCKILVCRWHLGFGEKRERLLWITRNLGARWAPISSWWPSATLLALRACLTSSFTPFGHSSRVTHADDKFTSVLEQVRFQERGEQCHFGSFWAIWLNFGCKSIIFTVLWNLKKMLRIWIFSAGNSG